MMIVFLTFPNFPGVYQDQQLEAALPSLALQNATIILELLEMSLVEYESGDSENEVIQQVY